MDQVQANPTSGSFNTNNLLPGYTRMGFSYVRSEMFGWVETQNKYMGIPVILISKATEYLEFPIRTIEDIALIAINLVGALFNEGCRNNLNGHLADCIWLDIKDALNVGLLVWSPVYRFAIIANHIFDAIYTSESSDGGILDHLANDEDEEVANGARYCRDMLEENRVNLSLLFGGTTYERMLEKDRKNKLINLRKERVENRVNNFTKLKNAELDIYFKTAAIQKHGYRYIQEISDCLGEFGNYETIERLSKEQVEVYATIALDLQLAWERKVKGENAV